MVANGKAPLQRVRLVLWGLAIIASLSVLTMLALRPEDKIDIGGPFTLIDHTGQTVSDTDFRGKYLVVYFGFTYCPDVCPTSLQLIGAALQQVPDETRAQIQPILISVDPERDTPEQMAPYVEHFVPGMVGLTGSLQDIQMVADSYRVAFWKSKDPNSSLPYTVDHASIIFIMDKRGEYVAHTATKVLGGENLSPGDLADLIEKSVTNR